MSNDRAQSMHALPIACSLEEPEQIKRREELSQDLFKGCEHVEELADGYAFRYPGSEEWATRLTEFILFERRCCPFFIFELVFEPNHGPIWLRLRGEAGVKQVVEAIAFGDTMSG